MERIGESFCFLLFDTLLIGIAVTYILNPMASSMSFVVSGLRKDCDRLGSASFPNDCCTGFIQATHGQPICFKVHMKIH